MSGEVQLVRRTKLPSSHTGIPSVHTVRAKKLLIQAVNGAQEAWAAGWLYYSEATVRLNDSRPFAPHGKDSAPCAFLAFLAVPGVPKSRRLQVDISWNGPPSFIRGRDVGKLVAASTHFFVVDVVHPSGLTTLLVLRV